MSGRIAHEMSDFPAVRVGDHAEPGLLFEGRHGAGNEDAESHFAGDGRARLRGFKPQRFWALAIGICAGCAGTHLSGPEVQ